MQTNFTAAQRLSPDTAVSERQVRACVHCGFCNAVCPTHLLLGDELDGPRGRIYQIKAMLERGGAPDPATVLHVDRCLGCLACMTTCPSGVDYRRLVDHARSHIEQAYARPAPERLLRWLLAAVLPSRRLFRAVLRLAELTRPLTGLLPGRLKGMVVMAPRRLAAPDPAERSQVFNAAGPRRMRVGLLVGCVQPVLAPQANAAAIRLLTRLGVEVVSSPGAGCCGALPHHLGKTERSHDLARRNIAAWSAELDGEGLDAIVVTASGCGSALKDYGFMFRDDPVWAARAARISSIAKDVSEVLASLAPLPQPDGRGLRVAYQSPCSLQHGQSVADAPQRLLRAAGYVVVEPSEPHICCGGAGTYSLLQPELSAGLRDRKLSNLAALGPDVVATGNIGCMVQLAPTATAPVVHTVELLDWAYGGPKPGALAPDEE